MHDPFLDALSRPEPIPGGGAAAAYGACVGLALLEKIVRVEIRRRHIPSASRLLWKDLLEEISNSSSGLLRLRDEDGRAYVGFAEARTTGREEEDVVAALKQAIECPIMIMTEAQKGLSFVSQAGKHCKAHLLSDLLVVCALLQAAIQGACRIAQANLGVMAESPVKDSFQNKLSQIHADARELFRLVEGTILERAGFSGQ